MFNTSFASLKSAMELNKLTEAEVVEHLKMYYDNRNYRENYNKSKAVIEKQLNEDPAIAARRKALRAKLMPRKAAK